MKYLGLPLEAHIRLNQYGIVSYKNRTSFGWLKEVLFV
jgi:hypothetical protein